MSTPTSPPPADRVIEQPESERAGQPFVRIDRISKRFGDVVAVDAVSLDIYQGEFFSLLGGSGCGKTTLLRMLAGLEMPDSGHIWIDGQDMTRTPPYRRPVNMMFQSYALFPHMNVFNNVAFGLKQDRVPKRELRTRVDEALAMVELSDLAARRPDQLSGGQRQRVALARALVKRPKLLLLDEPLAALDRKLRERTQLELARIQERVGITFVLVTHDQEEAMNLSTRIAVMRDGGFEQVGTPQQIYESPANRFVAGFVGSANLLACEPGERPGELRVRDVDVTLQLPLAESATACEACWVALRPEKIRIERLPEGWTGGANAVAARIEEVTYLGAHSTYHVRAGPGALLEVSVPMHTRASAPHLTRHDAVLLSWAPESVVVLVE